MIELFDYQKKAIEKLDSGKVLCAGTGVGKSLTALSYYIKKEKSKCPFLYIITEPKKRDDLEWESEFAKLYLDSENITVDSWNNIKKYENVTGAFFIFDEQRAVGSGSWAQAFIKITKSNRWIMLTATPGDTWSDYIPLFIANGFYKNRSDFTNQHIIFNRFSKFPQIQTYMNVPKLKYNKEQILVNMSKNKETVIIEKEYVVHYDKTSYMEITKNHWDIFNNRPIENASQYVIAQRRICNCNPLKLDVLDMIYNKHHKLIVFYNFDNELELLRTHIKRKGWPSGEYNGHRHDKIPKLDEWIYLVQYTAGAKAWNCVTTDTIVFFSKTYSYKDMVQAKGRIDRVNTPFKTLYYYYIKTNSSIDRRIDDCLHDKRDFNMHKWYKENVK